VVTVDGADLRNLHGSELRRRFGVVPQDPFIFRSTLRDNLRVACPEADDTRLRHACEQANAWEFISSLPAGLDTKVGEGGSTLSGGQRQRLSIARVLLADPPFFIFDEATSALDTLSEQLIQQAIERNLGGRTAIFIAHRLATVKHCDRILVVRGGRIEQDGGYDQLVAAPGLFRDMVDGQSLRS
jgi:ATP-binding cassette, subfamily B, bacterial MsbA